MEVNVSCIMNKWLAPARFVCQPYLITAYGISHHPARLGLRPHFLRHLIYYLSLSTVSHKYYTVYEFLMN